MLPTTELFAVRSIQIIHVQVSVLKSDYFKLVISGCAIQFMKDCQVSSQNCSTIIQLILLQILIINRQKQGKKFDYIFGDLTDTPVSTQPRDEDTWIFLSTILELAVGGIAFGFKYLFSIY